MNQGYKKYRPFPPLHLKDRTWPDKVIDKAPIWCSVDLRDGNQALTTPMDITEKLEFFRMLVKLGFKEIEVGFPSASETEYEFLRALIDGELIPEDVSVQVLTQCREPLIRRTFEAIKGAKNVIFHFYNNVSHLQRDVVFNTDNAGLIEMAESAARLIKQLGDEAEKDGMNIRYEYSPETFLGTEPEFTAEICSRVAAALGASEEKKMIINLPSTVECCTPNVFADHIENFCRIFPCRSACILSVHPHNDRGTGTASSEFALMAGAERIEGTLFGNGERTGNADIMNIALNMFSQGVDPKLDFSDMNLLRDTYERLTGMHVHERHPYGGQLVFTAFSGSHQDAINKGLHRLEESDSPYWDVPYIPIDPFDLGRERDPLIRINSQSGKGGAAYIMEKHFGYILPKAMHIAFGNIVQRETERRADELDPDNVFRIFKKEYLDVNAPYRITKYLFSETPVDDDISEVHFSGTLAYNDESFEIEGSGNGPIDAFFNAVSNMKISGYEFVSYSEHAISEGSDSRAVAYVQLHAPNGDRIFGVGISHNIYLASIRAIICAINRETLKFSK